MVVDDFEVMGISGFPAETDTELIIDSDAVLAVPIAAEAFQTVAWRNGQFEELHCTVDLIEFSTGDPPKVLGT